MTRKKILIRVLITLFTTLTLAATSLPSIGKKATIHITGVKCSSNVIKDDRIGGQYQGRLCDDQKWDSNRQCVCHDSKCKFTKGGNQIGNAVAKKYRTCGGTFYRRKTSDEIAKEKAEKK